MCWPLTTMKNEEAVAIWLVVVAAWLSEIKIKDQIHERCGKWENITSHLVREYICFCTFEIRYIRKFPAISLDLNKSHARSRARCWCCISMSRDLMTHWIYSSLILVFISHILFALLLRLVNTKISGEFHLEFTKDELNGSSWYQLVHWDNIKEAQMKHKLSKLRKSIDSF